MNQKILIVGAVAFGVGVIDSILRQAGSFADLSILGKVCALVVTASVLAPVVVSFYKMFKKK